MAPKRDYIPAPFAENREDEINRLVHDHPLATLVAATDQGLVAHHLPLLAEDDKHLVGHVALENDLHRQLADETAVLAIFRGSDAYISPNWYPTKQDHHRHVPTWNYQAVHVRGRIRFVHEGKAKTAIVGRLTQRFERETNQAQAWRMADAPTDYLGDMLDKIVGFRIRIEEVSAKSKLSQNRERTDFDSVLEHLEDRGESALAGAMRDL